MATVTKRRWKRSDGKVGEAWRLRYVDGTGTTRTEQFSTKGGASARRVVVEGEIAAGTHTANTASITVAQACELWIKTAVGNGRERSTLKQYREWAKIHIIPLIGETKLSKLTTPMVETFKDALVEKSSLAMAAKVVRGLSSVLADTQRRGLVAQNVAKPVRVVRTKRDKKKIIVPPKEDLRALLEAAKAQGNEQPSLYPMLLTVVVTGLRSSELRGLHREDVNLKAGEITVAQRADQWGVIGPPKSKAGSRTIPIPPQLVSELRVWMLRAPHSELGLMFPNTDGGVRLHSNMLNREYWPLQIAVGLTRTTGKKDKDGNPILHAKYDFHSLRHAAASAWIKQKVDLKRLTTWLGHSSVSTTLDTYGHLLRDDTADAAVAAAAFAELMA
ncbi:MAG: tyrosine-type recombinase/integrase [Allosphingosinicella sp.]